MTNILEAIFNISKSSSLNVIENITGNNRATNAGKGLEMYIKDAFSNSFDAKNKKERDSIHNKYFSLVDGGNKPPDFIIKGGDAIEVKKIETVNNDLQLNSSYPKNKLYRNSSMISKKAKNCENWEVKDIIYAIGHIPQRSNILSSLWFTYGSLYAANKNQYLSLKKNITNTIEKIEDLSFLQTTEVSKVDNIDPLGITKLRIRGMWVLEPPIKVYNYAYDYKSNLNFQLVAFIPNVKYTSFPESSRQKIEQSNNNLLVTMVREGIKP